MPDEVKAGRAGILEHGIAAVLDHWASRRPEDTFAVFDSGEEWNYTELRELVLDTARVLQDAGVRPGDMVVTWLENGPLMIRTWLAVNYLGGVHVPMNTAYRGALLEHALSLAEAKIMVTHADLVGRLDSVDAGGLELVYTLGALERSPERVSLRDSGELCQPRSVDPSAENVRPWDTQMVLYTSGTTGPSKAVLASYRHIGTMALEGNPTSAPEDRALVYTPLYHVTGISGVLWALGTGGSIAVSTRFRTSTFWREVRGLRATFMVLMGSVARFLLNEPVTEDERRTTLRLALITPFNSDAVAFAERVGIDFYTVFNMTEVSVPLRTDLNAKELYSCGRLRPGVSVRIVDENDIEVPVGQVGELLVRTDEPWEMSSGYYRNAEATASSLRNGWFHTGDAVKCDAAGNYFYIDRVKDSIRRRGENMSSYEIEVEVQAHPAILEAAAVAAPSEFGEDEVLVFVVLHDGAELDPVELIEFLRPRMAHFMIPRYIRKVDQLPRTPTQKVQKAELRKIGATDAWDREAAGVVVKRDDIGS
ncbi:AMP-binding protein [Cumulibacter soli]|uniref:AMP-binding protein n=1 Tax=Cumulibacter soli TaxID=2546344 RepID=UPI00106761E2|nr:AMP-binding protein [Cumulibacter soli]